MEKVKRRDMNGRLQMGLQELSGIAAKCGATKAVSNALRNGFQDGFLDCLNYLAAIGAIELDGTDGGKSP